MKEKTPIERARAEWDWDNWYVSTVPPCNAAAHHHPHLPAWAGSITFTRPIGAAERHLPNVGLR